MNTVCYYPLKAGQTNQPGQIAADLLKHLVSTHQIQFNTSVPIKVHFGEKGNTTFVPATTYDPLIDFLQDKGVETSFIETNVLYRGPRTQKTTHVALAKAHGFDRIPIIIADGDQGEASVDVPINKEFFDVCKIGEGFMPYDQIIVCSHFKGHGMAGFGGAIKQLAMGFASRGGKMAQHAKMVPTVSGKQCVSCGKCLAKCDVKAITMPDKAVISPDRCIGCAGCIATCPVGAIKNDWSADAFKEKVAEYAYGAGYGKRFIYINFVMNITEECDCMGVHMHKIAKDVAVMASLDPVALDTASLDLLQKNHGQALFDSGRVTLSHAEKIGLGTRAYTLVEIERFPVSDQ